MPELKIAVADGRVVVTTGTPGSRFQLTPAQTRNLVFSLEEAIAQIELPFERRVEIDNYSRV